IPELAGTGAARQNSGRVLSSQPSEKVSMTLQLRSPIMVASERSLHELARQLQDEDLVAVDTESNSLFAYREQVCLIQFSTRTEDWVVDPLAIHDLSPL